MKTTYSFGAVLLLAVVMLISSCGKNPAPETAAKDSSATPAVFDWAKMSHDQKKDYMKNVVIHKMRPLFREFDPERFEKITCKTCHHPDKVEQDTFKMPNPELEKLPATEEGWAKLAKSEDSTMMKFMAEVVKPKMAELMHLKPFDMKTNTGEFGCNNCHMTEGK